MGCGGSIPLRDPVEWLSEFGSTPRVTVSENVVDVLGTGTAGGKRNVVSWLPTSASTSDMTGLSSSATAAAPKALVLLCHGLHEHVYRHHCIALALAERGYAVWGMDHVGHGMSEGTPGLISSYESLVQDWVSFAAYARSRPGMSSLPVLLYAHSMGTLINFLALSRMEQAPVGAVFSGCALHVGPDSGSPFGLKCLYPLAQSKSAVTLARLMASLDPLGDAAPIVTEGLMHSTAEQDISRMDPRIYHKSIRNKTAYELLQLTPLCLGTDGIAKFPPAMHIAFHHGADDNLTLPSSSQVAFDACPCNSKTLAFHNGAKHEILHEAPEVSNAILASMCDFFDSSLAAGGAGGGGGISNPVASSPLTIAK